MTGYRIPLPVGRVLTAVAASLLGAVAVAWPLAAQLPSASASALGVADNFTARARGYNAVAWNPAGLGLQDNPGFSLALLPVRGIAGLDPITLSDLKDYENQVVPNDVKEEWLQRITQEGRQKGSVGADVTGLALNIGRLGFQASTTVRGNVDMAPDGAEAMLFGNAGRTGQPKDLGFGGSELEVAATSTLAVSLGIPLSTQGEGASAQTFAMGVTLKQVIGHFVARGEDQGSAITDDPLRIDVKFPVVHTDTDNGMNNGSGIGVDVGAVWRRGSWTLAGVVKNVVNTFEWDEAKLVYRPGRAFFDRDTSSSNFDERPFAEAPQSLKDAVSDLKYKPALAVAVALRPRSALTVSADFRQQLGDGITLEPKTHAGVGVELRPIPILPLRAGVSAVTGGVEFAGGVGLELGVLNLAAAAASRSTDLGTDAIGMFALSFGGR
ncbi:MAG: hypothetical protein HY704_14440 [Gemmatimonadetes bacterium]|nr:hypothetical protein [Gemmatimonadota bacterium]